MGAALQKLKTKNTVSACKSFYADVQYMTIVNRLQVCYFKLYFSHIFIE